LTDVQQGERETKPVVQYHSPEELYKMIDLSLPQLGSGIESKNYKISVICIDQDLTFFSSSSQKAHLN
jgi:hypothetical protein